MAAKQVYEDQAAVEAPLLKDLIDLGAEVTWPSLNAFSTQDNTTAAGIQVAGKPSWPALPIPYPSINKVLEDQAAVEAPLLDLGAEVTWSSPNIFSTQDNHVLGKFDLIYGGAGGQVKQVLDDQAAGEAPLLKDLI